MDMTQGVPKIYEYDFVLQIARALQERYDLIGVNWNRSTRLTCLYDGGNVCAQVYQKFYHDIVHLLEDGEYYYYQSGQFNTVTVQYVCSLLGFQMPPNPPIVGQILHRQKYVDFLKFICTAISCMNIVRRSDAFRQFHVNIERSGFGSVHESGAEMRYKIIAIANKNPSYLRQSYSAFPIHYVDCSLQDYYEKYYASGDQQYCQQGTSGFSITTQFVTNPQESSTTDPKYTFNNTAYPVNFLGYVQRQYPSIWNQIDHPQLCFRELPPPQQVANKTGILVSLWADWVISNCVRISEDLYMYETVSVGSKQSFKRMWEVFANRPTQITRDDLPLNLSTINYNAQKYAEIYQHDPSVSTHPEHPTYRGRFDIQCVVGGLYRPSYAKFRFQHNPTI